MDWFSSLCRCFLLFLHYYTFHQPPTHASIRTRIRDSGTFVRITQIITEGKLISPSTTSSCRRTYINVEALGEKESEKQLTAAWKRKRRRSKETRRLPDYLKSAPVKRVTHPLEESVILSFMTTVAGVLLTCVLSVPLSLLLMLVLPLAVIVKALAAACRIPWFRMCSGACQKNYLAPHDAQFLLQEGDSHAVIHSVLVIDASMSLKRIKQLLATRVVEAKTGSGGLMYPRLTQTVSYLPAGPAWVPDHNFNLHNHIFSGPSITTEEALQMYVSSLLSQPLPPARPLWEIIVLHDYGRSRDTVLVCRLHQCLSDGMSLLRVLCQSLSDNQIMHIPQKPHFGGTTLWYESTEGFVGGSSYCPHLALLVESRAQPTHHPAVSATSCTEGGAYTVWGEGRGEGQVVVWSAGVALSSVVRIKQVTRTCLNDVLLAALAGALRLTLQRRGVHHPPDLKTNKHTISLNTLKSDPPCEVKKEEEEEEEEEGEEEEEEEEKEEEKEEEEEEKE
ncbi:hypothetical protein Pmani_038051 [Petrolisthes manimaculis]|uniref:diacylglycerol O-acyltransferase n=1 Tax=Petrolisthes manimaculis TaxID=1843537 RepID=A0AAE1NH08_9EUCA|nr:hypothetical protein Pmani_038051 [Petrolisthes manimaculis]